MRDKRIHRHDPRTDSSTSEGRHLRKSIDGDTSVVLSERLNANNIGVSFLWEDCFDLWKLDGQRVETLSSQNVREFSG